MKKGGSYSLVRSVRACVSPLAHHAHRLRAPGHRGHHPLHMYVRYISRPATIGWRVSHRRAQDRGAAVGGRGREATRPRFPLREQEQKKKKLIPSHPSQNFSG